MICMTWFLAGQDDVGDEGKAARALDCDRDLTLVLGAVAGDATGNDLAALGDEVLQRRLVLEVDRGRLLGAEPADLLAAEAAAAPAALVVVHALAAAIAAASASAAIVTVR